MDNDIVSQLENNIAQLLAYCQRLEQDYQKLQRQHQVLTDAQQSLQQKHQHAVASIADLIVRLKKQAGILS